MRLLAAGTTTASRALPKGHGRFPGTRACGSTRTVSSTVSFTGTGHPGAGGASLPYLPGRGGRGSRVSLWGLGRGPGMFDHWESLTRRRTESRSSSTQLMRLLPSSPGGKQFAWRCRSHIGLFVFIFILLYLLSSPGIHR